MENEPAVQAILIELVIESNCVYQDISAINEEISTDLWNKIWNGKKYNEQLQRKKNYGWNFCFN